MKRWISKRLAQNASNEWGATGRAWVERLPALIESVCRDWKLKRLAHPYPDAQYNFVAPAEGQDGRDFVLKIGLTNLPEADLERETAALIAYDGQGAVRLIRSCTKRGALLLERAQPGTPLAQERDEEHATRTAARIMRTLWQPAPATTPFRSVATWAQQRMTMEALPSGIEPALVDRARALLADLLNANDRPVLLHGDLHHWNILQNADGPSYVAIDPKGYCGPPLYDVIAWLRNWPLGLDATTDARQAMRSRIGWLADELDYPPTQIAGWGFAGLLLDACWDMHNDPRDAYAAHQLHCALSLSPLI